MTQWIHALWSRKSALVWAVVALAGCNDGPSLCVPLKYSPSDKIVASEFNIRSKPRIFVSQVVDDREDRKSIGQSVRPGGVVPIYPHEDSKVTPVQFVQDIVIKELREVGLDVVTTPAPANRTIAIKLNRFWVTEDSLYRSEVVGEATVEDSQGRVLWSGSLVGRSRKFGTELSTDAYQKALSDSLQNLVVKMLSNSGFQKALY